VRVLVTGGAGFIGSHVARVLADHEVAVLDDLSGGYWRNIPESAFLYRYSLTDADKVDYAVHRWKPELIIHCAAYAAEGLSHWMRRYCVTQNLVSWANLANAAARHEVRRVVALSSMSVYGSNQVPFTEDLTPAPEDPYGATKAAMEADLRALGAVQGTEWIIVRPHNVYGPGQNLADPYRNVVAIFMRQALAGMPLTIFGDGSQVRAFSYIDDVARAIATLATAEPHGYIVNVGGEEPIAIHELARRVIAATGPSEVIHLPPRYEVRDAWCRHDVLRSLLGSWEMTDMATGLGRMAEWAKALEIGPLRRYEYEVTRNLYAAWQ
jgi:UDP-glucose 4-epimerase